ncbi:MAG TPA: DoxX family protein [Acidimicrobiales bacterium]|jgi:putative oxidoreductase|nr:DoxX family protein [Acidimicrobiales bacterium]
MAISRRIARPMMAGMFVVGGLDAARSPEGKAPKAEAVTEPLKEPLGLPDDTAQLVRINGVVQVVAGLMLATGRLPRLAALVLGASLVPTTLAGHRFWEAEGEARAGHRIHFFKNVSMLGGLILAATDTEGRPSLAWRARKAAARAQKAAQKAAPSPPSI